MKKTAFFFVVSTFFILSCKKQEVRKETSSAEKQEKNKSIEIFPIKHATTVLQYQDQTLYIDPTGGSVAFKKYHKPTIVLITDIHGDHMNLKTLKELDLSESVLIAPKAVIDKTTSIQTQQKITLNNNDSTEVNNIKIEAIPMYNLRKEALQFHPKGRGNGYVITLGEERLYFSGDTEDISEMRSLKNIDKAFVCMNLPYTMTVESAASAVLDFKPKQVYPYHYRGTNGMSDIQKFKEIVAQQNSTIEVVQLQWY